MTTPNAVNVVPTPATQRLAVLMCDTARKAGGADAVLIHLRDVDPAQVPALLGVLLSRPKLGAPLKPFTYNEAQRRAAWAAYQRGERSPWVKAGAREYRRANQRKRRAS